MKAGNEDENKKAAAALVTHLEMVFFFFPTAVPRHAQLQLRRIFSCCQGNKQYIKGERNLRFKNVFKYRRHPEARTCST